MRALGARVERVVERRWRRRLGCPRRGRRRLSRAARGARFRQFRHRLPARHGGGRGLPDHGDLRRRRQPAQATDAAHPRSGRAHGRAHRARERGRTPAHHHCRRARDPMPIVYRTPVPSAHIKSAVCSPASLRRARRPSSKARQAAITPNACSPISTRASRPCRDDGGGEIARFFASSQSERLRLQH